MTSGPPAPQPPGAPGPPGGRVLLPDRSAANRRASWALALAIVALLGAIAWLAASALDPAQAVLWSGLALGLGGAQALGAYRYGGRLALAATGARPATLEENRYLVHVVEAVAIGAGVPMPNLFVIDDPSPNAFATGRSPETASLAFTTGLLELLDRQELEGVVAHEMAHVRNLDVRFMTMLAATVGALVLLRDIAGRTVRYGGVRRGRRSSSGGGRTQAAAAVLLLVLVLLAPLLATLLRLAASRRREFLADAGGAMITRNPEGLARALEELRDASAPPPRASEGVQHLFFVNPLGGRNARSWLATHPPIQERIDALRAS